MTTWPRIAGATRRSWTFSTVRPSAHSSSLVEQWLETSGCHLATKWNSTRPSLSADHSRSSIPHHGRQPTPTRSTTDKYAYSETGDRTSSSPKRSASSEPEGPALSSTRYLARLGVGHPVVVDPERVDPTNCPRLVGARPRDLPPRWLPRRLARILRMRAALKVDVAERVAREANPHIRLDSVAGDVVEPAVVEQLLDCDAIFLAADSMRARLVVNAICHQYLIPTWQVGAKVQADEDSGEVHDVFSVVRQLVPGETCLWCNELVDSTRLAEEAVSPEQREAQRYIDEIAAPSVITLNAVATAHAVNDYLFATVGLPGTDNDDPRVTWTKHRPLNPKPAIEVPRRDSDCPECQGRLASGPLKRLPVRYSGLVRRGSRSSLEKRPLRTPGLWMSYPAGCISARGAYLFLTERRPHEQIQ